MKRTYVRPTMVGERFVANEYVAVCGTENKVYKFTCNAPSGELYYYRESDGEINGVYTGTGRARHLGSYHPCNAEHEVSATNDFYDGFVDRNGNREPDDGEGVIVWRGPFGLNGHATAKLDMNKWETAKS